MLHCKLVDTHHPLPRILLGTLGVGELTLLHLDMVFAGEILQRLPVAELLMLHYEVDRASPLAATEAFAYTFGAGYGE